MPGEFLQVACRRDATGAKPYGLATPDLRLELVVQQFAGGARFLDDLPKESLANDEELDAVRTKADSNSKQPQ